MREFNPEMFERERFMRKRRSRFHPMMFEELAGLAEETDDGPLALLMMAAFFRDNMPWIAELLAEGYRELRNTGPKERDKAAARLRRSVRHLMHSKIVRDLAVNSKEEMMLLDKTLDRLVRPSLFSEKDLADAIDPLE